MFIYINNNLKRNQSSSLTLLGDQNSVWPIGGDIKCERMSLKAAIKQELGVIIK